MNRHNDTKRSKVIKCSHNPKSTNQEHETKLMHPFYKNSEKYDKFLGEKYLFGINKNNTGSNDKKADNLKKYLSIHVQVEETKPTTIPSQYHNFNLLKVNRKLLQVNEETGDTADVIDDKAVLTNDRDDLNDDQADFTNDKSDLTDNNADHKSDLTEDRTELIDDEEQFEREGGIVKRSNDMDSVKSKLDQIRNEPFVTKTNDEYVYSYIDTIIKRAALQNIYNLLQLRTTDVVDLNVEPDFDDAKAEIGNGAGEIDNKVVKMSQAYSDYGVLDEKKEGQKFGKKEGLRSKMSAVKDKDTEYLTNNKDNTNNMIHEKFNDAQTNIKSRTLKSFVNSEDVIDLLSDTSDNQFINFGNEVNSTFLNNIHKTRKLLSIDANNTELYKNTTVSNITVSYNKTAMENSTNANITNNNKVVKRDINGDNFLFWDDLYDEEYGVKHDNFDDNEFKTIDTINFEKKTNWFEDKVNRLKIAFKGKDKEDSNEFFDSKIQHNLKPFHIRHGARIRRDSNSADKANGIDFKTLRKNMKKVMHEAILAVQASRNNEVRDSRSSEETEASSLMQQLIHLMTDLVDYRVHQKTCRQLPPDLQEFLIWLTASEDETSTAPILFITEPGDFSTYNAEETWTEKDPKDISHHVDVNAMSEYVKSLHAVENLLKDYNRMSENDKRKMAGVRKYLENQLLILREIIYNGELT